MPCIVTTLTLSSLVDVPAFTEFKVGVDIKPLYIPFGVV